jgi:DNA-binding NarL/FixJ family response regulator
MSIGIDIIEDNRVIRDSLAKFIGFHEDLSVKIIAVSIEDYLNKQKVTTLKSSILLLDIGLPGMSGIEGITHIKKFNREIDIIILTTYEEESIILKALCAGACSYLSKKSTLSEIIDAIRIVNNGGSYMSPSIARELVNHLMGGRVSKATILTERQREILQLLVDGKSYNEIARSLNISTETVKSHVKNLYQVIHVNNKSEAIAKYLRGEIE